ncbi:MAG TPA: hypothetical protein DEF51_37050 [Myxococcales bacterium]|nr:hypothetical protein [Myxococcales bacterium]
MSEGGKRRENAPGGGATMQLDAVIDDLEEVPDVGGLADLPRGTAPPPLPPKKAGAGAWVAGIAVVALMAGLGLGFGWYVLGWGQTEAEPVADVAEAEPAEADTAPEEAAPEESGAAEGEETLPADEESSDVVQLDEFVIDHE